MRRVVIVLALTAVIAPLMPAQAKVIKKVDATWEAPVPCTVLCTYWSHPPDRLPVVDGGDTDDACRDAFPEGAWDDVVVRAPDKAKRLQVKIYPLIDWDLFICSHPAGPTSKLLAYGAAFAGDCPQGCVEEANWFGVKGGKRYIIRAFNWSDIPTLEGTYWFYD